MARSRSLPTFLQRVLRTRADDVLPMRIEHQRIYILPTGRGWAFLFALLIMLIASINYALSLGYALSFLLTGLFAATLLHTYRNLSGLKLQSVRANDAFCGDALPFHLTLANDTGQPRVGIRIQAGRQSDLPAEEHDNLSNEVDQDNGRKLIDSAIDTAPDGMTDVPVEGSATVTLKVPTARRGERHLGRLTLSSDYPLGLWRTWSYVHTPASAVVYPRPETSPPPLPEEAANDDGEASRNAHQGDVAGLREYREGDALTSIAWKTAARGQGLHVRLFDDNQGGTTTTLSLPSTRAANLEEQLSRLTAWVLLAEQRGVDYAVNMPNESLAIGRGDQHQRVALTAFARYRAA